MTHEVHEYGEAPGGPEFDAGLPDALAVPVHDSPEDSDGPEFNEDPDSVDDAPPLPRGRAATGEV